VVQFFHWRLWDKSMAEDLAQEVFIKLWRSLESYDPRGPFKSYLFSIATNHLRDHMRRVKVRPSWISLGTAGSSDSDDGGGDLLDKLAADEMHPGADLEASETEAKLQQALSELPEEQYLVFSMHKHDGMKYEEIAAELDIKLGTIKSRMNAAYQHLRRAVYGDGSEDGEDKPPAKKSTRRSPKKRSKRTKRTSRATGRTGRAGRSTRRTLLPDSSADASADAQPASANASDSVREAPPGPADESDGMGANDESADSPAATDDVRTR
jgi:RNA polymerase sigma-70 factor (ECF subfamily)